ncbi:18951_t:CDS:1, partial [Gigaspora margarita]
MGHTKKSTFTPIHKDTKHTLLFIDFLEEQTNFLSISSTQSASSGSIQIGSDMRFAKNIITKSNLDMLNNNSVLSDPKSSDNKDLNEDISENEMDHFNFKRKDNENTNNDDINIQKRI